MAHFGIQVDGTAWEAEYRALLCLGHQKMEGALEICQLLCQTHRLFIVTNGVAGTQERRLKDAGLYGFLKIFSIPNALGIKSQSAPILNGLPLIFPGFVPIGPCSSAILPIQIFWAVIVLASIPAFIAQPPAFQAPSPQHIPFPASMSCPRSVRYIFFVRRRACRLCAP